MKPSGSSQHCSGLLALLPALAALFAWAVLSAVISPPLLQAEEPTVLAQAGKTSAKTKTQTKPAKPKAETLPWPQNVTTLAGEGAVLVVDNHAHPGQPRELYALNAEKDFIPASILKIVTSGAALEFLGPDFRFKTDFLLTKNNDLWIVGYGDPHLVSEELALVVKELQKRGLKKVRNILIDNSYFQKDIILDGNTQTRSPFDAYNGAYGANFNTVAFKRDKKGQVSRAAEHIPLTPLALKVAAQTKGPGVFTFNISESPQAAELNSGEIFKAHLKEAGLPVEGEILTGQTAPARRKIFYRHESSLPLEAAVKLLMEHSNNFMTNQIFLALGAEFYGPPASLEKSQAVMNAFFQRHSLKPITMGDGSGLSRLTTMTARQMAEVLAVVEPGRGVFSRSQDGLVLSKTGTMSDIKTLAGYLERPGEPDRPLSFVILLNGPNYNGVRDQILDLLKDRFLAAPPSVGSG
ncbi:MAG: D-alanyl-D-alanine carboxypeptidase [Candidatus Adiutrix sp.]|jgi:D-alanyl-D-alanine carboxypeptidase/D-alanyl-D-alanine-endopeptidase (penicillin-binding protein 4)|nr:D-alanyl-D-alanine carboxypeptidase [Candidatus Adiutrix sp.]